MAEVIRMPRLSDTMTEGVIVNWNKKVGDQIKAGDVLAEVETDKATMELESYNEGTLLYIGVEKGKAAKVDGILAVVGKEGEDFQSLLTDEPASGGTEKTAATQEPKSEDKKQDFQAPQAGDAKPSGNGKVALPDGAHEIRMPLLSDTMTEGKIVAWHKKVGDHVKSDDVLAEVETDKATMEVIGYEEGTLLYIGTEAGQAAKINEIIAIIGKPGTDVAAYAAAEKSGNNTTEALAGPVEEAGGNAAATENKSSEETAIESSGDGRIKASPLARKMAKEKGIDLKRVNGTGDSGRVTKRDIEGYKETAAPVQPDQKTQATEAQPQKAAAPATAQPFTPPTQGEGFTDIPLTQMRKTIARRLGESKFAAPHFYLTMSINMDNAIAARVSMNELSPVKISFNDMVIKACAAALRKHPDVNSSWMGDFIRQNHHIHIGSALALPEGLIVPVIRFADQKTLSQIAEDAKGLYQKAKDKKLQPNEFSGNTFTVSNLGMMDIDEFTAIINPPDSCIMAVGRIKEEVVKKGDGLGTTNIMKVTLSCDHRSVDGAVGASFLQTFKKFMENPVTMLV